MVTIAIDGPTGAGKSTIAKELSKRLGYLYLDTGACYRAVAYWAIKNGVDIDETGEVTNMLDKMEMNIKYIKGEQRIFINSNDVTGYLRTPKMAQPTSRVSVIAEVRDWLINLQRDVAKKNNVIMDGRDIGTVIMPNAKVKIFLTAAPEERAKRRHAEYLANGNEISYNEVLVDLIKRDQRDMSRLVAPLKKAEDAIEVDTGNMDFRQTVEVLLNIINDRIN